MKKLLSVFVLFAALTVASLSAWEPEDLTKYPGGQKAGDRIFNIGAGLPLVWNDLALIPLRVSGDVNVPLGDLGLPFFFGGSVGISGYKYADENYIWMPIGARVGYHFNWDIENLDTYAVISTGWTLYLGDGRPNGFGSFLYDFKFGARYFLMDWFGFWSEMGFGLTSLIDIGISFKF